jgi:hypothetical protein
MSHRYGHIEHEYASRFAGALVEDPDFRGWVLRHTRFAGRECRVLNEEMRHRRTNPNAPWWKNHFNPACKCHGCEGGRETDIFVVFEDTSSCRFALHVEVKQPRDSWGKTQAERYPIRARCWVASSPKRILPHTEAATMLLCPATKLGPYEAQARSFDSVITFEEVAALYPHATYHAAGSDSAMGR